MEGQMNNSLSKQKDEISSSMVLKIKICSVKK